MAYRLEAIVSDFKERGVYNSEDWRRSALAHFDSSKALRDLKNRIFLEVESKGIKNVDIGKVTDHISFSRSSIFLLAFAMESVLKSGAVSLFLNLPRYSLDYYLKSVFSHKLNAIAEFIELAVTERESKILSDLENVLTNYGRYPVNHKGDFSQQFNSINALLVDEKLYQDSVSIFNKALSHVVRIKNGGVSHGYYKIDDDGFLAHRYGGGIRPRVSVVYSNFQKTASKATSKDVFQLLDSIEEDFNWKYLIRNSEPRYEEIISKKPKGSNK